MLPLPGLSSASCKSIVVKFDGGRLSSDGGVLASREVEQQRRVADRRAARMVDPRAPERITHSLPDFCTTNRDSEMIGYTVPKPGA